MTTELLQQALAYVRWQAFGECRTAGWDGTPPTASELDAALVAALALPVPPAAKDAERLDWIAVHGSFGTDSMTGEVGGNGQKRMAATRNNIDEAIAQPVQPTESKS